MPRNQPLKKKLTKKKRKSSMFATKRRSPKRLSPPIKIGTDTRVQGGLVSGSMRINPLSFLSTRIEKSNRLSSIYKNPIIRKDTNGFNNPTIQSMSTMD